MIATCPRTVLLAALIPATVMLYVIAAEALDRRRRRRDLAAALRSHRGCAGVAIIPDGPGSFTIVDVPPRPFDWATDPELG